MHGKRMFYVDQHGRHYWASSVKELRTLLGGGRVSKMYCDKIAGPHKGKSVCCGVVIGRFWLTRFIPWERVT